MLLTKVVMRKQWCDVFLVLAGVVLSKKNQVRD